MNPRNTLLLLVAAALLGGVVYWLEFVRKQEQKQAEQAEKRLFDAVEATDVQRMDLTTTGGVVARLERREGDWRLVEPLVFPADATSADGMASALAQLQSEGAIEGAQAPEVYGLGEDASVVRFSTGAETHVLRIGDATPVGAKTYVSVDEDPAVYTVESFRTASLEHGLDDLRESRPLRFDRRSVQAVRVEWPGGGVRLERAGGPEGTDEPDEPDGTAEADDDAEAPDVASAPGWRLVEPIQAPADARTVDALLSDLEYLRAEGFEDAPPSDAEAGLAEPELRVELELGDGEDATTRSLAIGSEVDGRRLARGAEASLYAIASERLDDFPRTLGAYRYRTLAKFVATDAQSFELVFHPPDGEPYTVSGRRSGSGWTTEPDPMAPEKTGRMIAELARLRAEDVAADAMGDDELAAVGLAPPRAILRAFGTASEAEGPPLLGAVQLGDVTGEGIYARRPDADTVYRLSPDLAEHLPVSLEAFRNRFLSAETGETDDASEAGGTGEPAGAPDARPEEAGGAQQGGSGGVAPDA